MPEFSPLRFRFDDFCRELRALNELSKNRFFDASAEWIFPQLGQVLKQLQSGNHHGPIRWEVTENQPLKTTPTTNYEPGGGGVLKVVGEVSWCWSIRKAAVLPAKEFEISGNASVKLRVRLADDSARDIGMWRVECGASNSPGCFFHTQIMGEANDGPFPHSLSVPRLPTLFVTPMAAIEFFLGELFQDDWAQQVVGDSGDLGFCNKLQQQRLIDLLDWNKRQIVGCQGSPWLALKKAKPTLADRLFVGGGP